MLLLAHDTIELDKEQLSCCPEDWPVNTTCYFLFIQYFFLGNVLVSLHDCFLGDLLS